MAKKEAKYTLWTIPKSEWSQPMQDFEAIEANRDNIIRFAKELDPNRLDKRLRPFDSPVTQDAPELPPDQE